MSGRATRQTSADMGLLGLIGFTYVISSRDPCLLTFFTVCFLL